MGTTLTAMQANEGIRLGWVLAIEGCEYLLTDHPAPTVAGIGWNGLGWSGALPGLILRGNDLEQRIHPFKRDLDVGELSIQIQPDDDDTFGTMVHRGGAGATTELTASIDANDTTITVASTANFASSGTIHIGTERIEYSGTTATTFTGCTRGTLSPFNVDGASDQRFGRSHEIPAYDFEVSHRPVVSEQPKAWVGKHVALYAHRITGTSQTWDTKAQAQRIFAGTITGIRDTASGRTEIECEDIRGRLGAAVLLNDRYRAKCQTGVYLRPGVTFTLREAYTSGGVFASRESTLTVVSGAPADAYEVTAGYIQLEDLVDTMAQWISTAIADAELGLWWTVRLTTTDDGTQRVSFSGHQSGATSLTATVRGHRVTMAALGFDTDSSNGYQEWSTYAGSGSEPGAVVEAMNEPLRSYVELVRDGQIVFESEMGSWVSQLDWLPASIRPDITSGSIGILASHDGIYIVADKTDALTFTIKGIYDANLNVIDSASGPDVLLIARQSEDDIVLRQVVVLEGKLADLLPALLASTGASGYNHAAHDSLATSLGAGIPWDLMGSDLEADLDGIEADTDLLLTLTIDKPTRLWDLLVPEFLIRSAYLIWRSGVLRVTKWSTPSSAATVVHTLTEANKASADLDDAQRTTTETVSAYLANVVKIEWGRRLFAEEYVYTDEFRYIASISDHGTAAPVTVSLRNYVVRPGVRPPPPTPAMNALIADMTGAVVPLFGKTLKIMRRTVAHLFYEGCAPGDHALVTDLHARDPATGARGITGKPALIVGHRYRWPQNGSDPYGEVDLLFVDLDNYPVYAPSAQIDQGAANAGYAADTPSAGKSTITFEAHEFSKASAAVDISHFAANDLVYIYEVDDTAAATSWTATIESVTAASNTCVLNTNLAGFDTTASTLYRMESRLFSDAASQQRSKAYAADDGDLTIQDVRGYPYQYGADRKSVV